MKIPRFATIAQVLRGKSTSTIVTPAGLAAVIVRPLKAGDSITTHAADRQSVSPGYHTIFDLPGPVDLLGGAIFAGDLSGGRLTLDGEVPLNDTRRHLSEVNDNSTEFGVVYIPPAHAESSMQLEAHNPATSDKVFGWKIFTR